MIRNWNFQIQHPAQDSRQERNTITKDSNHEIAKAESQEDSSFPADGTRLSITKQTKMHDKSKTESEQTMTIGINQNKSNVPSDCAASNSNMWVGAWQNLQTHVHTAKA